MQIVLVGNPNSGKTSLFNTLTGNRQHVGNWPGVTVEKKEGFIYIKGEEIPLIDLPGIYSLDPDTVEQKLTRDYIFEEKPQLIINILDAANIERNLYLTLQLREFGIPMIIALNMMDEVDKNGTEIDMDKLSKMLGVPVLGISASKNIGIIELSEQITLCFENKMEIKPYCTGCSNCTKCKESEIRYKVIDNIVAICVRHSDKPKPNSLTVILDKVLLNRFLALPVFLLIMFCIFNLTFSGFVTYISDGINYLLNNILSNSLHSILTGLNSPIWLISLICHGIIPGIGMVLVFLPQIAILFILMSVLEDSGYMSRAAFIMDKIFSYFGLTGSSFIPLMMGFGCSVPAIMSCRILPSEKDRRLTIMLTPFISCSARLPVYALFAGVFFKDNKGLMIFLIYLLGIFIAFASALILNKTVFKAGNNTFVMEIPPYRLPTLKNLILHTWDKVKGFAIRAGTVLFFASIVLWFLQAFSPTLQLTNNPNNSIMAVIGNAIVPIFSPLGFGNWQAATAVLTGVAAKEMIVSTISVLSNSNGSTTAIGSFLSHNFTPLSAFSFMAFSLLYLPCLSTIITMKNEFNSLKWTAGTLAYSFSVAWVVSFLIYTVGRSIGL
jgi:ferrous iron transport protein B